MFIGLTKKPFREQNYFVGSYPLDPDHLQGNGSGTFVEAWYFTVIMCTLITRDEITQSLSFQAIFRWLKWE